MNAETLARINIFRFDIVDSTNEKAKSMLDRETPEGVLVVAQRQAAGRGRYGRTWASPPGGLYLSLVLKPPERNVQLLCLLSGLPVLETLREIDVLAELKWPNDVLVDGRKIAGVLCEGVFRHDEFFAVVGIGVNTDVSLKRLPTDVRESATSLKELGHKDVDNEKFLAILVEKYKDFYRRYCQGRAENLIGEYRLKCRTIGQRLTVETARGKVKGKAVDVIPTGALVVEADGKRTEVFEGTVLRE